jgi:hypothetical protein
MIAEQNNVHEHFEELCALAALGQISEREFVELQVHLEICNACRAERDDYQNLVHHKLPLVIAQERNRLTQTGLFRNFLSRNRRLEEQFRIKAQRNGLRFSETLQASPPLLKRFSALILSPSYVRAAVVVFALLLASIAVLGYRLRVSDARNAALAIEVSKLMSQNAPIQEHAAEPQKSETSTPVVVAPPISKIEDVRESSPAADLLAGELSRARDENATALSRVQALETQLQAASLEAQTLKSQVETGKSKGNELETRLRETEASLNQMNQEIQNLRSSRSRTDGQLATEDARVKDLSEKLKAQTEALDRERSLLAAGRDIRDLMGARNLHILDVFDVDGKGKSKRTFGRVFYTEGKSLIFYAFDLGDRKGSLTKASFQAWGYHASNERSYESLGVFYVDDKNQNRWVLKFDDPDVLAHIDSVFVTIEPSGGSPKPTGHKLLYAYLNNRPNHP